MKDRVANAEDLRLFWGLNRFERLADGQLVSSIVIMQYQYRSELGVLAAFNAKIRYPDTRWIQIKILQKEGQDVEYLFHGSRELYDLDTVTEALKRDGVPDPIVARR